jgi:hypothetical protein
MGPDRWSHDRQGLARGLVADLPPEHPFHEYAQQLLASMGLS